jgi:hypothetical protein
LLSRLGVSSSSRRWLGIRRLLSVFSMLVVFGAAQAQRGHTKRWGIMTAGAGVRTPRLSRHSGASKPIFEVFYLCTLVTRRWQFHTCTSPYFHNLKIYSL